MNIYAIDIIASLLYSTRMTQSPEHRRHFLVLDYLHCTAILVARTVACVRVRTRSARARASVPLAPRTPKIDRQRPVITKFQPNEPEAPGSS
jgi:hypothetical protein